MNEQEYWVCYRGQGAQRVTIATPLPGDVPRQAVRGGFGYYGILLTDAAGERVQCHLCGQWRVALEAHVRRLHGLSVANYKEQFELGPTLGLVAPEYSNRLRLNARRQGLRDHVKQPVEIRSVRPRSNSLRASLVRQAGARDEVHRQAVGAANAGQRRTRAQRLNITRSLQARGPADGKTSKYKGVAQRRGRWCAYLTVRGRTHWLGTFDREIDAARAYDQAVRERLGGNAYLNFPAKRKRP